MTDKDFINRYLNDLSSLVKSNESIVDKIIEVKNLLLQTKKKFYKIK